MQGGQPRTPVPGGALFPFGVQGPRVSLQGQCPSLRIHVRVQGCELCVCVCMGVSACTVCVHACACV